MPTSETTAAAWIAPEQPAGEMRSIAFWAGITWESTAPDPHAVLEIAAECHYRLWVNKIFVGSGPVRGARTVNFVDTHKVGQLLRPGPNSIDVAVQSPGWATFRESPALPSLWVEVPGEIATGPGWWTQPMSGWRSDAPTFTFQYGPMEWVDLADGPEHPPSEAIGRRPARIIDPAAAVHDPAAARLLAKRRLPRDIPSLTTTIVKPVEVPVFAAIAPTDSSNDDVAMLMQSEDHRPLQLPSDSLAALISGDAPVVLDPRRSGDQLVMILDFGQEVNGGWELAIEAAAGTIVDSGYGEHLDDGRVRTVVGGYRFADRQRTRSGVQTVGSWFADRGFRYLQLVFRDLAEPLRINRAVAIDRRYPFDRRASFASNDDLLNKIWDLSLETLAVCATDTFVDCPWRENTLYINDLLVENAVALAAFGDGRLTERCLRLALAEADENGLVPASVPNGLQPGKDQHAADRYMTFPATQLYLTEIIEDLLLYGGDQETVELVTEHLVATIDHLHSWQESSGLLRAPADHWNFVDWGMEKDNPQSLAGQACASLNWFWVRALDSMIRLSAWTGIGDDRVATWRDSADRAATALRGQLWDQQGRVFRENARDDRPAATQVSQALAITSGRLQASDWPRLDGADLVPSELYMLHYVLPADVGIGGTAAALERIRRHWGPIVEAGSPTIWECGVSQAGASAFGGAGSLCHGFSTSPVTLIQRYVLGVRPAAPGFLRFTVAPDLGDLRWIRGSVPTPLGEITVEWRRSASGLEGDVTVPAGAIGTLPDGRTLTEGIHRILLP